jgi:hypothetical protein
VANSVEAAKQIADITGKSPEVCLSVTRRLGEVGLIRRRSRGRSAEDVDAHELAIMVIALMALTDDSTPTVKIPLLADRVAKDPEIFLMGDEQVPTATGSFITTVTQAIEGYDDGVKGSVQAFGLQFCRGQIRAWAKWQRPDRKVFFGIRELPPGMVQESTIGADIIAALRQIPVKTPSVATDGSETTTPTQFAPGSAASSSESSAEPPFVRQQHEDIEERETLQALDSAIGKDSPSPNRSISGDGHHGIPESRRCPAPA